MHCTCHRKTIVCIIFKHNKETHKTEVFVNSLSMKNLKVLFKLELFMLVYNIWYLVLGIFFSHGM